MKEYRHYGVVYLQHCKCENISFFYLWCKVEKLCVFLHLVHFQTRLTFFNHVAGAFMRSGFAQVGK